MNRKKLGAVSLTLVALVTIIAVIFFQFGVTYQRQAELNISVETGYCMHIQVWVTRADGTTELIKDGVALDNVGTLTTIGKNYIEGKLGNSTYDDNTAFADDISVSSDTGSPSAAWTQIPVEITTGGLARASGAYASTGDGVWTISYQFTATTTHTAVQLTGLQWKLTPADNNLLGADTFTPVTLNDQDKLTVTWTITVS